jgi:hypothetical protein
MTVMTTRGNQLLQRLHTVKRGTEALPHFAGSGMRQKRGRRLTIPDARDGLLDFDGGEPESVFLELKLGVWKGTRYRTRAICDLLAATV